MGSTGWGVSGGFFGGCVLSRSTIMLWLVALWVWLVAGMSLVLVFVY